MAFISPHAEPFDGGCETGDTHRQTHSRIVAVNLTEALLHRGRIESPEGL